MTVPPTRDELLELAELDALGVLEPSEQARFERGLRDASDALRAELHAVQDIAVMGPVSLVAEDPDAGLKWKVMACLAEAAQERDATLAPIASIGARPEVIARPAALPARMVHETARETPQHAEVVHRVAEAAQTTELDRLRRLVEAARTRTYMLRAACIALAASLVVCGYALVRQDAYAKQVTTLALAASSRDDLKQLLGPGIEQYLRDGVSAMALSSVAPSLPGGVVAWIDPEDRSAFVALIGLDESRSYALVSRANASAGSEESVLAADLRALSTLSGQQIDAAIVLPGSVLEVRDPVTSKVLFRGVVP